MKNLKNLLYVLIPAAIAAACSSGGRCDSYSEYNCSFVSLRLMQAENVGSYATTVPKLRPVLRENYGIYMRFEMKQEMRAQSNGDYCNFYTVTDTIASIRIFSDMDFGTSHPAGSDVTDCFGGYSGVSDANGSPVFMPVYKYLENIVACYLGGSDYSPSIDLYCMLATLPDTGEYTFTVTVRLTNGREFEEVIKAILK